MSRPEDRTSRQNRRSWRAVTLTVAIIAAVIWIGFLVFSGFFAAGDPDERVPDGSGTQSSDRVQAPESAPNNVGKAPDQNVPPAETGNSTPAD